jgi:hypothetical protein
MLYKERSDLDKMTEEEVRNIDQYLSKRMDDHIKKYKTYHRKVREEVARLVINNNLTR